MAAASFGPVSPPSFLTKAIMTNELKTIGEADRSTYIGGSDAAAILGLSPWKTALDVYLDKTGEREQEDPSKAKIFARGKRMEPYIIDLLAEDEGINIIHRGQRYQSPQHPFMAAEIDAEYFDAGLGSVQNIEIKTAHPFGVKEWGEELSDSVPLHYVVQAMHGLMVTGRQLCTFGVLIGSDDFRIYRVERDEETITAMREKEIEFWQRVQDRNPPEPTTTSDIRRLFERDAGTAIEASAEMFEAYSNLRATKQAIKELEAEGDLLQEKLQVFMADAARLTMGGKDLITWKTQSTRRLDQKALAAAHPELTEQFKNTTETRVFRIK